MVMIGRKGSRRLLTIVSHRITIIWSSWTNTFIRHVTGKPFMQVLAMTKASMVAHTTTKIYSTRSTALNMAHQNANVALPDPEKCDFTLTPAVLKPMIVRKAT